MDRELEFDISQGKIKKQTKKPRRYMKILSISDGEGVSV